jgi:hypothetical protein
MFIGHIALGLAAKRAAPRVSLAVLLSAAQFADLLWPVLVAFGVEQVRISPGITAFTPLEFVSYPYSHSLLLLVIWGVVFGAVFDGMVRVKVAAFATAGKSADTVGPTGSADTIGTSGQPAVVFGVSRTFVILAALVVSHWLLDFVTHVPDMPLYPGGPKVGLGLWNSIAATMGVEIPMYVVGVWMYLRATRPRDRRGRWGFVGLAAFLGLAYVVNIVSPPPPTVTALWITALVAATALTLWAWWADRHREAILTRSIW